MFRNVQRSAAMGLCVIVAPLLAQADASLNTLFSDHMVLQRDIPAPVFGRADAGEKVTVSIAGQEVSTTADAGGRWSVLLKKLPAGGPLEMTVKAKNTLVVKDILVGEVWVCSGQSNMQWTVSQSGSPAETIAAATNAKIRFYQVPRQASDKAYGTIGGGKWTICSPQTAGEFSAVGYGFARYLSEQLGVAVGMLNTSYGGTVAEAWTSPEGLAAEAHLRYLLDVAKAMPADNPNRPTGLYNAMIHPLLRYAIRGAIWYQGESNADRAAEYRELLPQMIRDWRRLWGQGDFPFYIVQLAPFMKIKNEPSDSAWAELREAQRETARAVPNAATIAITDLGDEKDIHPKQKALVGERLAFAALGLVYEPLAGRAPFTCLGPDYESCRITGDKVYLNFRNVGPGLAIGAVSTPGAEGAAAPNKLVGFTIAGADRVFHPADAKIEGNQVVVSSPKVPHPVAVRFGWADFPVVNLWNKTGLPALPFRTDDFPLKTAGAVRPIPPPAAATKGAPAKAAPVKAQPKTEKPQAKIQKSQPKAEKPQTKALPIQPSKSSAPPAKKAS